MVGMYFTRFITKITMLYLITSCAGMVSQLEEVGPGLDLPFIKNTAEECYYLDEFMPTPDNMVAGRNGSMSLRYYTYNLANYKDWENKQIILSFYSADDLCWSLFEEYYIQR